MQYLAGFGLDLDRSAVIYTEMLAYRRFPEDLFAGSEVRMNTLRKMIQDGEQ